MENAVTQVDIDMLIESSAKHVSRIGKKTCVVCLQLPSGFEITETSACVDPANYSEKIGEEICMERIKNKLWELEGYKLQNELFEK